MTSKYRVSLEILQHKVRVEADSNRQALSHETRPPSFQHAPEALDWVENELAWILRSPSEYIRANK